MRLQMKEYEIIQLATELVSIFQSFTQLAFIMHLLCASLHQHRFELI